MDAIDEVNLVDLTDLKSDGATEEFPDLLSRIGLKSASNSNRSDENDIEIIDLDGPCTNENGGGMPTCKDIIADTIPQEIDASIEKLGENENVVYPSSTDCLVYPCESNSKIVGNTAVEDKATSGGDITKPGAKRKKGVSKDEKEEQKRLKMEEKTRKKEDAAKAKRVEQAYKQVEKEKQRMLNAAHCEMFVTTVVDPSVTAIFDPTFSACMNSYMAEKKANWKTESVLANISNYICWKRRVIDFEGDERKEYVEQTKNIAVVLPAAEFHQLICKNSQPFIDLVTSYKAESLEFEFVIVIVGTGTSSKKAMDALTELQLCFNGTVQHRTVANVQELCQFVKNMHRAIALAPKKRLELAKAAKELDGAIEKGGLFPDQGNEDIKHVVCDLWNKMLAQIPNLSSVMAKVITDVYMSPSSLLQAYSECENEEKASLLLKDLKIDRGDGVGKTSRKLGQEMSKRVYQMLTCQDGNMLLR